MGAFVLGAVAIGAGLFAVGSFVALLLAGAAR